MSEIRKIITITASMTLFILSWNIDVTDAANGQNGLRKSIDQQQREVQQLLGENGETQQQPPQTQPAQPNTSPPLTKFQGTILAEKDVPLRWLNRKNRVALLKTNEGARIAVDLGPSKELKSSTRLIGKKVGVEGRMLRVGNRLALFASGVSVDGKNIQIIRPSGDVSQRDTGTGTGAGSLTRKINGRFVREREISVQNTGTRNKIILMKTDRGTDVVADLGPVDNIKGMNLSADEPLEVQGQWIRVGTQPVLLAGEVTAKGEKTEIQQPIGQILNRTTVYIQGEIQRKKLVKVNGTNINNMVLLVKTDKGEEAFIDLGPTNYLTGATLVIGGKIQIQGWPVRIGDRYVILARTLQIGSNVFDLRQVPTYTD